jgi:hypothetical protein
MARDCGWRGVLRWGMLALLLVAASCGDNSPNRPGPTSSPSLVFTRADLSTVRLPAEADTFVWCGWWGDVQRERSVEVRVQTTQDTLTRWELRAAVRDIRLEVPMRFPNRVSPNHPDSAEIFLLDVDAAADWHNEASTQEDAAAGEIVFHALPCSSSSQIDFEIDATLGSEYPGGPSVGMKGRFVATVTGPPQ